MQDENKNVIAYKVSYVRGVYFINNPQRTLTREDGTKDFKLWEFDLPNDPNFVLRHYLKDASMKKINCDKNTMFDHIQPFPLV